MELTFDCTTTTGASIVMVNENLVLWYLLIIGMFNVVHFGPLSIHLRIILFAGTESTFESRSSYAIQKTPRSPNL